MSTEPAADLTPAIQDLLLSGRDPFADHVVPSVWATDAPDVASINGGARQALVEIVEEVAGDGRSRAVLLRGEAGTGKTHTLSRLLRDDLDRNAVYVYVNSYAGPRQLTRLILGQVAANLARRRPGSDRTQIEALLDRLAATHGVPPLSDDDDDETIRARVNDLADRLCLDEPGLDRAFVRVFLRARVPRLSLAVTDFLAGRSLDDEDLARLGVKPKAEVEDPFSPGAIQSSEASAFEALKNVALLARFYGPIVLCFDQTESLIYQEGDDGEPAARWLVSKLCNMHDAIPNVAIIFACLPEVWIDFEAKLLASEQARLSSRIVPLSALTPDEAVDLVAARLQRLYGDQTPPFPTFPFDPELLRRLVQITSARDILRLCSRQLVAMREAGKVEVLGPERAGEVFAPRPPKDARTAATPPARTSGSPTGRRAAEPTPRPDGHREGWWADLERAADRIREGGEPTPLAPEALPDVLGALLRGLTGRSVGRTTLRAVEVRAGERHGPIRLLCTLDGPAGPTRLGVAFGEHAQKAFHGLVERLRRALDGRECDALVYVRQSDVKATWKKGIETWKQIEARGARRVRPDARSLVYLAAFRDLVAAAGDLDPKGTPDEVAAVLAVRLAGTVPLVTALFEGRGDGPPAEIVERVVGEVASLRFAAEEEIVRRLGSGGALDPATVRGGIRAAVERGRVDAYGLDDGSSVLGRRPGGSP